MPQSERDWVPLEEQHVRFSDSPEDATPSTKIEDAAEVVEFIADLIARRHRKGEVKRILQEELQVFICEELFARLYLKAKKIIAEAAGRTRTEHRALAVESLEQIIRDPESSNADRIRAIKELNSIYGLGERYSNFGQDRSAEEIAAAIAYFVTAPWTTGTVLEVDGGLALGITKG